jgi:hypothetical protein
LLQKADIGQARLWQHGPRRELFGAAHEYWMPRFRGVTVRVMRLESPQIAYCRNDLPLDVALRSIELFGREVMPALRAMAIASPAASAS